MQNQRRGYRKEWAIENFQIHREFEALKEEERLKQSNMEAFIEPCLHPAAQAAQNLIHQILNLQIK